MYMINIIDRMKHMSNSLSESLTVLPFTCLILLFSFIFAMAYMIQPQNVAANSDIIGFQVINQESKLSAYSKHMSFSVDDVV